MVWVGVRGQSQDLIISAHTGAGEATNRLSRPNLGGQEPRWLHLRIYPRIRETTATCWLHVGGGTEGKAGGLSHTLEDSPRGHGLRDPDKTPVYTTGGSVPESKAGWTTEGPSAWFASEIKDESHVMLSIDAEQVSLKGEF